MAYGCSRHRDRGSAVCPVTVYQNMAEVQAALVHQLQTYVLGDDILSRVLGEVRGEIEAQIPQRKADIAALEAELATVRAEQKRLAKAVALADNVPELVTELHQRLARIQNLEAQLIAAKRTPAELAALVDKVEANVRVNVASLRTALADQADLREASPFEPAHTPDGARQIWKISGAADFRKMTEPAGPGPGQARFRLGSDPNGIRSRGPTTTRSRTCNDLAALNPGPCRPVPPETVSRGSHVAAAFGRP